ncbi:MAG: hypothetical protein JWO06_1655 [Bacteroidota bacterium]|nr:hypothetical protein [Bacteroidota bacterium]
MEKRSILLWIIPLLLAIWIIVQLIAGRKKTKITNQTSSSKNRFFYLAIIAILLGVIGMQYFNSNWKSDQNPNDKGIVTPQELAAVIDKPENYAAGIFIKKGFTWDETTEQTRYRLYKPDVNEKSQTEENILEYAYILPAWNGFIFYVFKNDERYDSFVASIRKLNLDSISGRRYIQGKLGDFPAYKYKNCVFVAEDYWPRVKGKTVVIFRSDLLKSDEAMIAEEKIAQANDCFSKDDYRFVSKVRGDLDFIRFYNRNGNIFQFSANIENDKINGKLEKQGNQLVVVDAGGQVQGEFTLLENCNTLVVNISHNGEFGRNPHSGEFVRSKVTVSPVKTDVPWVNYH